MPDRDSAVDRDPTADSEPAADLVAASDLGRAAYCPRQLYYAREQGDREPPAEVGTRRALAFRYPELRDASDATLADLPIAVSPAEYRGNLDDLAAGERWDRLADPAARDVLMTGKDCRGVAHKLLAAKDGAEEATDSPPIPVLVSGGVPPPRGVWEPQTVRAVALAKALAWERAREIPRAIVEYPAVGVVRPVRLTACKTARYRELLRLVRGLDAPPPRLDDDAKCEGCDYREACGVKTRSLRSLLGL
ncbi:MAG: CRISPR-associated protein Cas4 [Halolamina sp.]